MKNKKEYIEAICILLAIFGAIMILIGMLFDSVLKEKNEDIKTYNNGICQCGGHYELVEHSYRPTHPTEYIYQCNNCKSIIILKYNLEK